MGHIYKLAVPIVKCNRTKYFYSARVMSAWNSLPGDIYFVFSSNFLPFKKGLCAIKYKSIKILNIAMHFVVIDPGFLVCFLFRFQICVCSMLVLSVLIFNI